MPISITCECGKKYRVKDTLAGKKIRCADCSEVLKIPVPVKEEVLDEEVFDALPANPEDEEEELAPLPPKMVKRRSKVTTREVERDSPAPRKTREKGGFGTTNSGVLGGVLMIILAIVWFVGGLFADRIFFYPPILLIIGIVAVIKGLVNAE
jgi:hypothetical protein